VGPRHGQIESEPLPDLSIAVSIGRRNSRTDIRVVRISTSLAPFLRARRPACGLAPAEPLYKHQEAPVLALPGNRIASHFALEFSREWGYTLYVSGPVPLLGKGRIGNVS
jgi:hypothetical protein